MRDVAACIAQTLHELGMLPGLGPEAVVTWARRCWPHASRADALRGYEIAVEVFEDDYLFEQA